MMDCRLSEEVDEGLVCAPPQFDAPMVLDQLAAGRRMQRMTGCTELQWAATWADLHPGDAVPESTLPGTETSIQLGGDGTPEVAEFAPAELATTLGITAWAGRNLIADALDLRHRHPRIWERIAGSEIEAWQACKVAKATRPLTYSEAKLVDATVAEHLGRLPWGRMQAILDAAVIEANPERAAQLAAQARSTEKKAYIGQSDEHGLTTVYARIEAADAIWLNGMLERLADILATRGDTSTKDQRRATALGLLAHPAQAIQLLMNSATTGDTERDSDNESDRSDPASTPNEPDQPNEPSGRDEPDLVDMDGPDLFDQDEPDLFDESGPPEPPDPPDPDSPPVAPLTEDAIIAAVQRLDPDRLRPPVTMNFHIAEEALTNGSGVARVEGIGPLVADIVRDWLPGCTINQRPVIDLPARLTPVDSYEIPRRMRDYIGLSRPTSSFPFAASRGRLDIDHPEPYQPDGPPGQTCIENLSPLARFEHRLVTHGRWQRRQPEPGTMLFRAPHGHIYLVDHNGTHTLGNTQFAHAVWQAATPKRGN